MTQFHVKQMFQFPNLNVPLSAKKVGVYSLIKSSYGDSTEHLKARVLTAPNLALLRSSMPLFCCTLVFDALISPLEESTLDMKS